MPVPDEESLFSLEIVIDKLYIPHVVCRFPAVAFRLLDFPTILINHVEAELADKIKRNISRDPHYAVPDQFSELQDSHANYIIKKGKSCLFKTTVNSLKSHLSNTPLYVMALDMFPETPKLVGNSSVPLDGLMKHICADIVKKGVTVPSVHGDKGLFKIYSLMGNEIGYIVLGFRLLCLGPGMVGHIPNKSLLRPTSTLKKDPEHDQQIKSNVPNNIPPKTEPITNQHHNMNVRTSHDMGSMTDAIKKDVLLQTITAEDKAVHVVMSEPDRHKTKQSTTSTQTEKKQKHNQHVLTQGFDISMDDEEDNTLNEPNIFCPPPLFYNRHAEPMLQMEQPVYDTDDESEDGTSKVESIIKTKTQIQNSTDVKKVKVPSNNAGRFDKRPVTFQSARSQGPLQSVNVQSPVIQNNTVFPVLTALLNELVGIQGSHGLENVIQTVGDLTKLQCQLPKPVKQIKTSEPLVRDVARSTLSTQNKKLLKNEENAGRSPRSKGWIRKVPESVPKTGRLTYRLTKTQKLRIAKSNPKWLKDKVDKEESLKLNEEDLNVTNFSDTLTEVRRLAAKELANETLDSIQDISSAKTPQSSPKHSHKNTSKAGKKGNQSVKINPKPKSAPSKPLLKSASEHVVSPPPTKLSNSHVNQKLQPVQSSPSVLEHDNIHKTNVAMEPNLRKFMSPDIPGSSSDHKTKQENPLSSRSENGLKVHLPQVPLQVDSDDDISLPDNDKVGRKLSAGLIERSNSFRESILGKSQTSFDISHTADNDDGPLESTRTSQDYQNEFMESKVYQSTTDNDTKQFMSTEEPELKQLMTSDKDSDESVDSPRYVPTFADTSTKPSVRSSMKFPVLNPVASDQSPIPTTRKSTIKPEARSSTKVSENMSSPGSSMVPTPRARKYVPRIRESIHTESVSSYMPSDGDPGLSLNSDANYSDDFQISGSIGSVSDLTSSPDLPRRIPSTKLGYTIS